MRHGWLIFLLALSLSSMAGSGAQAKARCRLLSNAEVDQLVQLTPEAQAARNDGSHPRVLPSGHLSVTGNHPSTTRLLIADRGGLLDNGILGYFTVDRVTGRTFDETSEAADTSAMQQASRRMLGRC
jgi:hypothetical protein